MGDTNQIPSVGKKWHFKGIHCDLYRDSAGRRGRCCHCKLCKTVRERAVKDFGGHIAENTLVLTDGLRSYYAFETLTKCSVVKWKYIY